ncbi:MAG: outer membrane protein transport protein [Betaproteobacteria bacterium]|nr:outer membrane protein transport protein [Betaproteobacteria bacterium]
MATLRIKLSAIAVGATLAALASSATAGGFGIGTQAGSGTGNAFSGGAAAADDASVAWYNPAGMTLLPAGKQVTLAGHLLKPSFKYQDQGSTGAFAAPGTGNGGDGGDWALVPNGFFTMEVNPQLRFGVALNVPFGLKTEYDSGWRGQLTALKSEIKTININPSVAYKVNNHVSIGAGISVQKIEAELTNLGLGPLGISKLEADDVGYGFNVGIMVQATPSTRIGATYRSTIKYDLEGSATFSALPAANAQVKADFKVPDSASLSIFSVVSPKWEVMADVTWTGWSSVQRLNVTCASVSAVCPAVGGTLTALSFNWKDTLRFGVGANYKLNNQTKLRFGLAFDETPTNDVDRTPRLPDQDRTWIAFGVQYKPSKAGVLEMGYAHEFIRDARVSTSVPPAPGALNGSFENRADILSIQYSHSF